MIRSLLALLFLALTATAVQVRPPVTARTESLNDSFSLPASQRKIIQTTESGTPPVRAVVRSLDEIACSLSFAPLDLAQWQDVAFDSSLMLGFRVSSGNCPECPTAGPIRIETLDLLMRRSDGSPADTLDVIVSVYCPFDALDACQGAGVFRDSQSAAIAFAQDSFDGHDEIRDVEIPVGVTADSVGAFLVVQSLGFRSEQPVPRLSLAINGAYPVLDCSVWIGHTALQPWADYFAPQLPGLPAAAISLSCDLADSSGITPCALSCTFSPFSGNPVYFDPFANVVYQWVDESTLVLPVSPLSVNLQLFFEALGQAADSAYFRVLFACPSFGDNCCPPGKILWEIPFAVQRGTEFQTVLNIQGQLGDLDINLTEPFWFGVVIDSVSGQAALPSFLYSSRTQDSSPPTSCEQWCGVPGSLNTDRQDDLGWADISFLALCQSQVGTPGAPCTISPPNLNCAGAINLVCTEQGVELADQIIPEGTGTTDRYCCSDLSYESREQLYRLQVPEQGSLALWVSHIEQEQLTLFLLSACDPRNCITSGRDSISVSGLSGQEYILVIESFDTLAHEFSLQSQCFGDCIGNPCLSDVRGPGGSGNRYLDGEGNGNGTQFYYSYYPGSGSSQTILRYDAATCASLTPIVWQSLENSPSRMLAYDPRNGGEFWCGTTIDYFAGTGRLYRVTSGGGVVQSWTWLAGLPIMRWSGAAFDAQHNHLWVMIRDSMNTGNSRAFELDLSNAQQPIVIQGPHPLLQSSPNQTLSSGGADYADSTGRLLVVHQGSPDDFVQCYTDNDPDYAGPLPGPGLSPTAWCAPDSNSLQGFGLAAIEGPGGGEIAMLNYTDVDGVHPLMRYPAPCRLIPFHCVPPNDLRIRWNGAQAELVWSAPEFGTYEIYSSLSPVNDGNPDGGTDTLFHLETSLTHAAGLATWADSASVAAFKTYCVILECPSGVVLNSQFGRH